MGQIAMKDGKALKQSQMWNAARQMVPQQMSKVDPQYRALAASSTEALFDAAHANAVYMESQDEEHTLIAREFSDLLDEITQANQASLSFVAERTIQLNAYNNLHSKREVVYSRIGAIVVKVTPEKLRTDPRIYIEEAGLATMAFEMLRDEINNLIVESITMNKAMREGIDKMRELQAINKEEA